MKKFLAKIGLFIMISTILASLNFAAYADEIPCDPCTQSCADSSLTCDTPTTTPPPAGKTAAEIEIEDKWTKFAKELNSNACVTTTDANGNLCKPKDNEFCYANKVITYVEEAFGEADKGEDLKNTNPYIIKRCVRNTWVSTKINLSITQMLNECMTTGPGPDWNPADEEKGDKLYCQEVYAVISDGGTAMISGYIGMIYRWGASFVGLIAVLVIVLSGVQIATSGGDSQAIESAKDRILKSIGGIVVLFLSGLILYTVNPNFFTLG